MGISFSEILKPFKYVFILFVIGLIMFILLFINLASNYEKNMFEVTLNGVPIKYYYEEKLYNGFFTIAGDANYNNIDTRINKIDLNNNSFLYIKEFEVYSKNGIRKINNSGGFKDNKHVYKEVNNTISIEIKRMNKVLYKGNYIKDITKYMNEKGRYYIHIYVNRNLNQFSSVKTHISFNVIVGGGNHE